MEQRYELKYEVNGEIKICYPNTEESKNKNLKVCKENGYKVISVTKLYPFSTNKNQHNFMLVKNRCYNIMYDMDMGYIPYNKREYDRLYELAEKADKLLSLELPVAWLDGKTYREAKKVSQTAIEYRVNTCIERGRYDLIKYC